jgi:biotin carboxylase
MSLDIDILIASEGRYSLIPEVADGLQIELRSPDEATELILEEAQNRYFDGVVATDDATVELASRVAESLGVVHNRPEAAKITRRKDFFRHTLDSSGVPVPGFRCLDLNRDLGKQIVGVRYPCVVKPLALSASRGVIRADHPWDLMAACARVERILLEVGDDEERTHVLVEDFIEGSEVAVEGMLCDGELHILALFDKPEPLNGPFFEETYYVTPSRLPHDKQALIRRRAEQACAACGLREGPVHAEFRVGQEDVWVLELAARTIGGECARLLQFGAGRSLEELVLTHAIGGDLDLKPSAEAAGVMMIPTPKAGTLRRVEGILDAQRVPYVEDVVMMIREGYELVPLPEGASYLGFIFARGPTAEGVEHALRDAHACLNIVVAPMWRLEPA